MESETLTAGDAANFNGLRVVAFESRMAAETGKMIERLGGKAIIAPAMCEVPLEDNRAALDFGARLLAAEFEIVILLTGIGTRTLFGAMETRYPLADLVAALGKTIIVVRGPKPAKAVRDLGLEPALLTPEPNTWRALLADLSNRTNRAGKKVAVQEYGVSNQDLIAGLDARGAIVTTVPVYRWTLPTDRRPVLAALKAIASGQADVALFTSATQAVNVLQLAEAAGIVAEVRRGFAAMAIGSIGPVCSAELSSNGIDVDFEPEHSRLGHLIKEAAQKSRAILDVKRKAQSLENRIEVITPPPRKRPLVENLAHSPRWDHPFMKACRCEPTPYTPIWLMRQAGRYMPEYRKLREQHGFLEMCARPELAAEVTAFAARKLNADAAIIFADILLPLVPMEVGLHYEKGEGPQIDRPIRTDADLDRIPEVDISSLAFVGESIKLTHAALGGKIPLIGFAGAPFTLASYMIEGGSSRQYQATKTMMYNSPDTWHRMMTMIARVTTAYLNMQVDAGADVVQLFDSWVGSLGPDDYRRFVLPHTASIISAIKPGVPVIHFGTVTGNLLELMREAGGDVIGLDWRVDLAQAWAPLGSDVAVQATLDPIALFAEVSEIRSRARAILDQAGGRPGHIFNLGHGILPDTPVDHAIALVDAVHEITSARSRA